MRVIVSGGGTAGHIYPALAVAAELRAEGRSDVLFVGTPGGLEARLASEAGVPFVGLPAKGFDRSRPVTLLTSSVLIGVSTVRACLLLHRHKPDVVAGFGGYASIPLGLAAAACRIPLVLHEQNSVAGMANRVLSRWARAVALTYEGSSEYLHHPGRARLTGNPVRAAVLSADRMKGRETVGVPADARMLLVFGGSRGARRLNRALGEAAIELLSRPDLHIVHIAGRAEADEVRGAAVESGATATGRYHVREYVDDMGSVLAAADVVVARAGATSIAEITALGRPAVLVPYPYATDDHQTLNASAVAAAGGAVVVADAALDASRLLTTVGTLLDDEETRARMRAASLSLGRADAARVVADLIVESTRKEARA